MVDGVCHDESQAVWGKELSLTLCDRIVSVTTERRRDRALGAKEHWEALGEPKSTVA